MALDYTEHTWGYGEEFTPDKLNNMEHGIKAASDAVNEVNNNLSGLISPTTHVLTLSVGTTAQYTCYLNNYEYLSKSLIHVALNISYDVNIPMFTDIAYVPNVASKRRIPCMIKTNDVWMPAFCIITPDGTIQQEYTSNCRGIYIDTILSLA